MTIHRVAEPTRYILTESWEAIGGARAELSLWTYKQKKISSNYSSDTIFDARELWQANSHLSFPFITPTLEDLKAETMWFLSVVLL